MVVGGWWLVVGGWWSVVSCWRAIAERCSLGLRTDAFALVTQLNFGQYGRWMGKSFRELKIWQQSMELTALVYQLTAAFPYHERYGLSSQMRRAAVSIPSNIAEGAGRETRRDFRQFVLVARGSNCELHTQLLISVRLGYSSQTQTDSAERLIPKSAGC